MEQVKTGFKFGSLWWKGPVFLAIGLLLLGWLVNTPPGLLGKADAIGYAVCHRINLRSFHLGDRQIPLCARCTGMYLGAMLGLLFQATYGRRRAKMPPKRVIFVLGLLVMAFGIDGLNSYLHLFPGAPSAYQPQNWLRLLTGTGMGLVISAAIYPAFNQTIWRDWDDRPALPSLRAFGFLASLALALDLIVLTENPLLLYPLALISAGGVIVLLTLIYSMVGLMVFRKENQYQRLGQLLMPLTCGFGLALLQIVVLDMARYVLTGTWDGFHLG